MANVLLRLSVNDLIRCRCVSKQWLEIINSPHFIGLKLQRSISTNSNYALFLQKVNGRLLYRKERDINWRSREYVYTEVMLMGSCDGLVCYTRINHPYDLVVVNPSTLEQYSLSGFITGKQVPSVSAYGFGYDRLSNDYKVVMIMESGMIVSRAVIYGVRAKRYSATAALLTAYWKTTQNRMGVFVGGALHWCIMNPRSGNYTIHALDLGQDTFCQLPLPDYDFGKEGNHILNVGVVESSRLCLCASRIDEIDIWVMKEYGNPDTWSRIYCIENSDRRFGIQVPHSVVPVGTSGVRMMFIFDRYKFVRFDPGNNFARSMAWLSGPMSAYMYFDDHGTYEATYCVESLVKIFPNPEANDEKNDYDKQVMNQWEHQEKSADDQEKLSNAHPAVSILVDLEYLLSEDYIYEGRAA